MLAITVGPPGAGKSVLAAGLRSAGWDVVSPSRVRAVVNGDSHDRSDPVRVWSAVHGQILRRLSQGSRVLLAATNLKTQDRACLLRIARRAHVERRLAYRFDVDLDSIRAAARCRPDPIPSQVIERMWRQFETEATSERLSAEGWWVIDVPCELVAAA